MEATMTKKTRNTLPLPDNGFADGCEAGLRPAVYLVFKEGSAPGTGLARSRKQRPSIHFQDGGYDD